MWNGGEEEDAFSLPASNSRNRTEQDDTVNIFDLPAILEFIARIPPQAIDYTNAYAAIWDTVKKVDTEST